MNIYCEKNELLKSINNVSHAVPVRSTSKILEGILIEVKEGEMFLTATDTTITVESSIKVKGSEETSFVIPSKIFGSIIGKLPNDEVMLEYDEEKSKLKIKCAGTKADIFCYSPDEFPKIKLNDENSEKIKVEKSIAKSLIRKTAFSASPGEMNGILTGVLIEIDSGKLKMVAVDTFRMAIASSEINEEKRVSVVVPGRLISEVSKIINDEKESPMTIEIIENKAVFIFDNNRIILNTQNGKYIDYKKISNRESSIKIRAEREKLINSIDRASILSLSQNNNLIKFKVTDELIEITSLSESGNIEEKIDVIKEGNDVEIGFNSKFMMDALKAIEDEEIIMEMKDNVSPCIITPVEGDKYLYMILPVRIN